MEQKIRKRTFQSFPHEISVGRVLNIQGALASENCRADCILIITGIDSRFNIGSKNALEQILPGISDYSNLAEASDDIFEDAVDDLVICIKKESVHIYCNPINYNLVMMYAAPWSNLVVHCLNADMYENHEDISQELKIRCLVEMVNGCHCVAIPYYYGVAREYQPVSFDPMLVEKWPLIQAFALEDIGGGSFFTLKFDVIDGTRLLNDAFSTLDQLSLEILMTKHLPQFEKQWQSLIDYVSMSREGEFGDLDASKVAEPLITYFHHAPAEEYNVNLSEPCVRFGVYTNSQVSRDGKNMRLRDSGINGSHAYHMVCTGRDSSGAVSCTRTYFCQTISENSKRCKENGAAEDLAIKELSLLTNCYLLAVKAFDLAVEEFTRNLHLSKCDGLIKSHIIKEARNGGLFFTPDESKIEVVWRSVDRYGRECSFSNGLFHNIAVTICDIPSLKHKGEFLGSVSFSDTFLKSTIHLNDASHNTQNLLITQAVKRFVSWQAGKKDAIPGKADRYNNDEESFIGNCLIESSTAVLIYGKWPIFYTDEIVFYGFEKELILYHNQSGYISIPCNDIEEWTMFDNDSNVSATLIRIKPKEKLLSCLPFWISKDGFIKLALMPRSKAHSAFYDNAFHVWKETKETPLKICNELLGEDKTIHDSVEKMLRTPEETGLHLMRQFERIPNLKRFYEHIQLSSNTREPFNEHDLQNILDEGNDILADEMANDDSELTVTILTGLPGSGSDTLCKSLVSLAREASRWLAIKVPSDIKFPFNAKAFQEHLSVTYRTITQQKGRPQASSRKRRRLIIQTQGFVAIRDVVSAIEEHPDELLRSKLKIGSVTCCIDPNNLYLCGRMHMPFVLEQCSAGFVNQAVFTSCIEPGKAAILAQCQKLIRYCNPEISFLIAKRGEVTRTPDVELILSDDSFRNHSSLRSRKMFHKSRFAHNSLSQVTIPFNKPVDKTRFLSCLKNMKGAIDADVHFEGVILYAEGRIAFTDYSETYTFKWSKLLGLMSLSVESKQYSPRPPSSKPNRLVGDKKESEFFVTFFGMKLEDAKMKLLMLTWAQQRKQPLNRADLTKAKLDEIAKCHKFDALPPGWFYNGSQFVSFEGGKQNNHPYFENYVDDYISKLNEEIDSYNDSVDNKDLFTS